MKLKYYLRGLGIGIIVTTIILMIAFSGQKNNISDEEVIRRAEALGMVFEKTDSEAVLDNSGEEILEQIGENQVLPEEQQESETTEGSTEVNLNDTQMTESEEENQNNQNINDPGAEENGEADDTASPTNEPAPENTAEESYTLKVEKGMVCRDICEKLQENGVVDDAEALRVYLGNVGYAKNISTGTYELPYGLTYEEIYHVLSAGPLSNE